MEQLCDASVRIESFAGALTNASSAASAYHGLFHVHKIPVLNSLIPSSTKLSVLLDGAAKGSGGASASGGTGSGPGSGGSSKGVNNLGFKVRRKRFAIETFHLPPEGGVGQRRTSSEPSSSSSSLSDRKSSSGSSSPSSSSSSTGPKKLSSSTEGGRSGSLGKSSLANSTTGQVNVHSVPGASGMARKMMGLPPKGIQGAVASGCSTTGGSDSTGDHAHGSSHRPGVNLGANSSLLDF